MARETLEGLRAQVSAAQHDVGTLRAMLEVERQERVRLQSVLSVIQAALAHALEQRDSRDEQ